jgi:hypothetical protein
MLRIAARLSMIGNELQSPEEILPRFRGIRVSCRHGCKSAFRPAATVGNCHSYPHLAFPQIQTNPTSVDPSRRFGRLMQISGAVVLAVATSTLIHVLRAIFRERKKLAHIFDLLETSRIKPQQ